MIKLFQMLMAERITPSAGFVNILLDSTWATVNSDPWGYPAANTIDEDLSTFWHTDSGTFPNWIVFDLGEGNEKAAGDIILATRSAGDQHYWKDFKLQGSSNSTSWTDIFIIEDYDRYANGVPQFFPNSDTTTYRYFRYYITETSSSYCCMGEVMLYENASPGGDGLDAYTVSLVHFDRMYNFYTWQLLRDEASYGSAGATFTGVPLWFASEASVASYDNITKKFDEGASLYFDGTKNAPFYLWPYGTFTGASFGTGNWCFEIQVAVEAFLGHDHYVVSFPSSFDLSYADDGSVTANFTTNESPYLFSVTSATGQVGDDSVFNHIAIGRYADNFFLYIEGGSGGTIDCTGKTLADYAGSPWLGGNGGASSSMKGWLDEMRISKGTSRYTGAFSPPTEPF